MYKRNRERWEVRIRKLVFLAALASAFLLTSPVMAQTTVPSTVAGEQYAPSGSEVPPASLEDSVIQSIEDAVKEQDPDGVDAYEAALEAAREAGADDATAQIVATRMVEESSGEMTVLPATGGVPLSPVLAGGVLLLGATVLVRRVFL